MDINRAVENLLARRLENKINPPSLIITLFGDYVSSFSPQGIPLSVIIELTSHLGLKSTLVRTSINRLMKSGWLSYTKEGRHSIYYIAENSEQGFSLFSRRIYNLRKVVPERFWTILLLDDISSASLQKLRRQLLWLGYSPISARTFVHPGEDITSVHALLDSMGLSDTVIIGSLVLRESSSRKLILKHMQDKLPFQDINQGYQDFLSTYAVVGENAKQIKSLTEKNCFMLRLLLVHDYRRIVLRDPDLPTSTLPKDWQGGAAQKLLSQIYILISKPATKFFAKKINSDTQLLRVAQERTHNRFRLNTLL